MSVSLNHVGQATQEAGVSDIVQQIINAADLASKWEPDHPQYVEGALYLTQAQWDAVRNQYPPNAERRHLATHAAWGIPVHIVKPGVIVDLPSGRVLVYSATLGDFYVFDRKIADDAGLCSGLSKVAEVEPAAPVGNQPQEQR